MAKFSEHIGPLIAKEGGYMLTDTAGDRGGRTYAGISERANPYWDGWKIIEQDGLRSRRLREAVHTCYRTNYWDRINGDELSSDLIAEALFSSAVLSGPNKAVEMVQQACGATVDGVMGPLTLRDLYDCPVRGVLACLSLARIARFSAIVQQDKSQEKFFRGWVNRVLREFEHSEST